MKPRNLIAPSLLLIACVTALSPLSSAQQAPANPSLDETLLRLRDNYLQYHDTIPNFYCDEHAVSLVRQRGTFIPPTTTDSTFRLRRNTEAGETRLYESRDVKTINNKSAPPSHALTAPTIFTGAFSEALAYVTSNYESCFDYRLTQRHHKIAIDYSPKPPQQQAKSCPTEPNSGRAIIDPQTLQITRIEDKVPNHPLPGSRGLWIWTIDFSPVNLDGQTFWLPRTIDSTASAYNLPIVWTFTANYSNCHKLNVTSHVLPSDN
jgi:hypothetical protein